MKRIEWSGDYRVLHSMIVYTENQSAAVIKDLPICSSRTGSKAASTNGENPTNSNPEKESCVALALVAVKERMEMAMINVLSYCISRLYNEIKIVTCKCVTFPTYV